MALRQIGRFGFPGPDSTREEINTWEPTMWVRGMHTHVVAVGRSRIEGAWACYIVWLPKSCDNHLRGAEEHWGDGAKADEALARLLFPQFEGVPYAL